MHNVYAQDINTKEKKKKDIQAESALLAATQLSGESIRNSSKNQIQQYTSTFMNIISLFNMFVVMVLGGFGGNMREVFQ